MEQTKPQQRDDPNNPDVAVGLNPHIGIAALPYAPFSRPASEKAAHAFLNELTLFGLGYSWGGFESLAILFDCTEYRTATKWAPGGPSIRFHIGLEDPDDLTADLERGFAALAKAG